MKVFLGRRRARFVRKSPRLKRTIVETKNETTTYSVRKKEKGFRRTAKYGGERRMKQDKIEALSKLTSPVKNCQEIVRKETTSDGQLTRTQDRI